MSKFTANVVQKYQPQSFNQLSKTAFSQKTAKFAFIALLTFAIVLTSFAAQAIPQKSIAYSSLSSQSPNQTTDLHRWNIERKFSLHYQPRWFRLETTDARSQHLRF